MSGWRTGFHGKVINSSETFREQWPKRMSGEYQAEVHTDAQAVWGFGCNNRRYNNQND